MNSFLDFLGQLPTATRALSVTDVCTILFSLRKSSHNMLQTNCDYERYCFSLISNVFKQTKKFRFFHTPGCTSSVTKKTVTFKMMVGGIS